MVSAAGGDVAEKERERKREFLSGSREWSRFEPVFKEHENITSLPLPQDRRQGEEKKNVFDGRRDTSRVDDRWSLTLGNVR